MNVTRDGFIAGADNGLSWHFAYWSGDMAREAAEQLDKADTILLGRITYVAMAAYWPFQTFNPNFAREDIVFADMMNNHKKVVFSKTLIDTCWNNSLILTDGLPEEVHKLKQECGKDIIVLGSASIVNALIQSDLVDEYQLWLHPLELGDGKPLFQQPFMKKKLKLVDKKRFISGVVLQFYKR